MQQTSTLPLSGDPQTGSGQPAPPAPELEDTDPDLAYEVIRNMPDLNGLEDWRFRGRKSVPPSAEQIRLVHRAFGLMRAAQRFMAEDDGSSASDAERGRRADQRRRMIWRAWCAAMDARRWKDAPDCLEALGGELDAIEADILTRGIIPKAKRKLAEAAGWSLRWLALAAASLVLFLWLGPRAGVPAGITAALTGPWLAASGAMAGRFVSFMALYRNHVQSEADYNLRLKELPHRLGPWRDAAVAVAVHLTAAGGYVSLGFFSEGESGFQSADFAATWTGALLLGFLVGLVLPLVVDRMVFGAARIFGPEGAAPGGSR